MAPVRIYVSHSAQDNDFAERLAAALQSAETRIFFDRHVNDAVSPAWPTRIIRSKCSLFVLVLSPAALQSVWARTEYVDTFSRHETQWQKITEALAVISEVIGEEHSEPFRFLEADWLRHIVVVLAQPVSVADLTEDWSSVRALEIVWQEDLTPLPDGEGIRQAQEKIVAYSAQSGSLLRGLGELSSFLADWVFKNVFDFPYRSGPEEKRMLEARNQMVYLFTEKQKRLILANTTIAEDALFNQSEASASQEGPPAIWCPVATVAEEQHYGPGGQEIRLGTKHFRAGTKVYCLPPQWGDEYEDIVVVGRHRSNRHYVEMAIPSWPLTNWRTELVYSPSIRRKLEYYWDGTVASKLAAQELAEMGHQKETQHRLKVSG